MVQSFGAETTTTWVPAYASASRLSVTFILFESRYQLQIVGVGQGNHTLAILLGQQ